MTWPANCCVCSLYWRQKSMMFTPCCPRAVPTGGAGVACPARICSLTSAWTFLRLRGAESAIRVPPCGASGPAAGLPRSSDLGDLVEPQLDRSLPVEDVDQHLQLALVDVDLVDRAVEVGERPADDPHDVAFLELEAELRLHLLLRHGEDLLDLPLGKRRGLGAGSARDEPGDAGGVPNDVPGVVV